ncbi:MAG: helix-turn-helix domain-containing protein [Candidatus Thermoplasmatota archaeon]|jgi:DNA-binding IclR family transcriptional regulator
MSGRVEDCRLLLQPTRARVYQVLESSPMGLTEIARQTSQPKSTLLHHLQKLIAGGLVELQPGSNPPRYRRANNGGALLAKATRVLHSVPARELMQHVLRRPGQHLGEAASALGAPRSRYWRVMPHLEAAGLIRVTVREKARLLFPTQLVVPALRTMSHRKWAGIRARRTRRAS